MKRSISFVILDFFLIILSVLLSLLIVTDSTVSIHMYSFLIILLFSHYMFSILLNAYKKVWQYASLGEFIVLIKTISFAFISAMIIFYILYPFLEITFYFETYILLLLFIGGSRIFYRLYKDKNQRLKHEAKRTLIVGAGSAGQMTVRHLLANQELNLLAVAFIDDDPNKHDMHILNIPVVGNRYNLSKVVHDYEIDQIIIAIPSLRSEEQKKIIEICLQTGIKTKILPKLEDFILGKSSVEQLQDIQIEDLLGRDPVVLDMESIHSHLDGKVVLVTGAGGSIGSEICRQVIKFNPSKLILLGHGENSIYSVKMELEENDPNQVIHAVIADIKDKQKMYSVMEEYRPQIVYHAAAHKHVPLMEEYPEEAVKNNIIGTLNVAQAAHLFGVEDFVFISTDKAVNPTSVMGASKRLAEKLVMYMNKDSLTKFVVVRFGNVLGSRGSVIPLFKNQILKGGPVTVTHPEMVRYFMTIPEASRLVIQAGALAEGGEIFVLDMGEPVKIVDLAKKMITLSGRTVEEIGIKFTGIRPGEKLFEELLSDSEIHSKQIHPKIYVGKPLISNVEEIFHFINQFSDLSREEIKDWLLLLCKEKKSQKEVALS